MDITVNKTDFVRELALSQGVVERRVTIPVLSNVLMEAAGDRLYLTATDMELSIRCCCPAQVQQEGSGTLPARRLLDYVRLLPDADIRIRFDENHWATITCGRAKTRIAGLSRENFPEFPEFPDEHLELPVALFEEMIPKTIFAMSTEESRFTLNGALLVLRGGQVAMVTTDGHRLALVQTREPVEGATGANQRAILPRKTLQELLKLAGEFEEGARCTFAADEHHTYFQFGDRVLASRKLAGTFPDYEKVLPRDHPYQMTARRDEFRAALERVSQYADERSRAVKLELAPGELKVSSSLSDTGESEETLPVDYDGDPLTIAFNAQYLLEFLRAAPGEEVLFSFRDAQSAAELRPAGEEDSLIYRYVVMPMRL